MAIGDFVHRVLKSIAKSKSNVRATDEGVHEDARLSTVRHCQWFFAIWSLSDARLLDVSNFLFPGRIGSQTFARLYS